MKTAVIGGGPGGMTAAISAAQQGDEVFLFEQNEKLGKKLYITGKGRCNLTNACSKDQFFENIVHNPRFIYSAYSVFANHDLMSMIEDSGCPLKTERGNRVFPVSDKSSDVIKAFDQQLKRYDVKVLLNKQIRNVITVADDGDCRAVGIETFEKEKLYFDKIIMATGGLSYRSTGSDGSGLNMAKALGHKIKTCRPSLVGIVTKEKWPTELQGLTLKNVGLALWKKKKKIGSDQGEMLFTHFGISGPMVLSHSARMDGDPEDYHFCLDLKPALDSQQIHHRVLKDFEMYKNKKLINALKDLLPSKMIPIFIELCGLSEEKTINQISKAERQKIERSLKELIMNVEDFYSLDSAIITSGGIDTKMINPKTMESKLVRNLFFAGEMIDVDGLTGGYNIQLAASTGWLAGMHKGE